MTSGNFEYLPLTDIIINREERQRRELKGIEELAESIRDNGLINPIVVTKDRVLIAGERRFTAHQHLGFDMICVQYAEDLDTRQLHLIELEENVRREDLSWQDHVRAVAEYHKLQKADDAGWSQNDTASALNMSSSNMNRIMLVSGMMEEGVQEVLEAPKLSTAANFAQRKTERKQAFAKRDLMADILGDSPSPAIPAGNPETDAPPPPPDRFASIIQRNFIEWATSTPPLEKPYNLIHCDFPYGVSAGDTKGQSGAAGHGGYEDSPDIYFDLLETFCMTQDRFTGPSAHLVFWFSMDYYTLTVERLQKAGWRVDPFPLIWHKSDNTGILPDPNRGPRRTYETALFASRGDRKVVKAVANSIGAGTSKEYHMSEKSRPMLDHFFRMLVDESTLMLDPTCGSGNAVKAAEMAGAAWSTGFELNPEYVERAKENLGL